jgi:outer membrane protein
MKRFFLLGAVYGAMMMAAPVAKLEAQARGTQPAQATRFAFVNSQRILAEAPGAREAQQSFERDMQRFRIEVDSLEQALEQAQADFQRQQATISPAARTQRQQEIQEAFVAYQQRVGELERTAQRRQTELVEPVMQRISEALEQIRREGNYGMIFDASAGALITADPSLDITDRVLTHLRQTASR